MDITLEQLNANCEISMGHLINPDEKFRFAINCFATDYAFSNSKRKNEQVTLFATSNLFLICLNTGKNQVSASQQLCEEVAKNENVKEKPWRLVFACKIIQLDTYAYAFNEPYFCLSFYLTNAVGPMINQLHFQICEQEGLRLDDLYFEFNNINKTKLNEVTPEELQTSLKKQQIINKAKNSKSWWSIVTSTCVQRGQPQNPTPTSLQGLLASVNMTSSLNTTFTLKKLKLLSRANIELINNANPIPNNFVPGQDIENNHLNDIEEGGQDNIEIENNHLDDIENDEEGGGNGEVPRDFANRIIEDAVNNNVVG